MPKFFVKKDSIGEKNITLSEEDSKHVANVLRKKIGDKIIIGDGEYTDFECEISEINKKSVVLKIISSSKNESEPKLKVTLFQGLTKGDKFETIIQKCVEIGVTKIVPTETENAVVKSSNISKKIERYNKISESAAKQSGRGIIPIVSECIPLKNIILSLSEFDKIFVCYEKESVQNNAKKILKDNNFENVAIIVGPEGGFSSSEIEFLESNGVVSVSLGKRILRTETAPLVFLTILMYELGEF